MYLPANLAISARSRKFYDGTYALVDDGFTDEVGVFRAFDCLDPAARAPTPLPPMFDDDEEAGEQIPTPSSMPRDAGGETPVGVRFAVEKAGKGGYEESVLGGMDGGKGWKSGVEKMSKRRPKKSGAKKMEDSSSPLSDCPSDLSDWEGKKKKTTPRNKKKADEGDTDFTPKRTRGVAQKVVRKTPRKAATAPALVARQQDVPQQAEQDTSQRDDGNWRRRSTRRTRNSNGW